MSTPKRDIFRVSAKQRYAQGRRDLSLPLVLRAPSGWWLLVLVGLLFMLGVVSWPLLSLLKRGGS
jgi:hypothetical protein